MSTNEIIANAKKASRTHLTEIESKTILEELGIATTEPRLAKSRDEAISFAKGIGFPVVLKVSSADIVHKSDSGGVKLGLANEDELARAYDEIMASIKRNQPDAVVEGVSVQKMARPGVEVIIGMSKDPQFGPVLMFGLGGIFVEILKDVSFRIVPLTKRDAHDMIREIKGYPVLEGYRGQEPGNVPLLEDILLKVSDFADKTPQIKEMDLNPIFAYSQDVVAVDARIILE